MEKFGLVLCIMERPDSRPSDPAFKRSHSPPCITVKLIIGFGFIYLHFTLIELCWWHMSEYAQKPWAVMTAYFYFVSANEDFKQEGDNGHVCCSPRAPDNDSAAAWLCIVAAALVARRHWCRTTASVWETELPFRLSQRKHSREKWQEDSWAFWFRRHRNNSQKESGPRQKRTSLVTHYFTLFTAFMEAGTRISTATMLMDNKHFFI